MAKQPSGASGRERDPGAGRKARSGAEHPSGRRTTLAQAKQAVDQYMREAMRLYGAVESSVEAAQGGAREINRKAISFAERNVYAAFDFAQRLVRAKDRRRSCSSSRSS